MKTISSSDSEISVDSLEVRHVSNNVKEYKDRRRREQVVISVPFYEKDVLIKIPKDQQKKHKDAEGKKLKKKDLDEPTNYLINKEKEGKTKRTGYLEIFKKQTTKTEKGQPKESEEVDSLSPEVGDTTRESFDEETNTNPVSEFFNTESYNEIYYDKLINPELFSNYLEESFEEEIKNQSSEEENLRSVSEVTQRPPRHRRPSVQPIQNMKLGGLGPDMEAIKPRLERARSLQRYSEKVRMDNRLKIYKKSIEADADKKTAERKVHKQVTEKQSKEIKVSYLQQKTKKDNPYKKIRNVCSAKFNSAAKEIRIKSGLAKSKTVDTDGKNIEQDPMSRAEKTRAAREDKQVKSSKTTAMNTEKTTSETPPIHISFLVNVDGVRPSSALRNLEEKHRIYQEQVKGFKMDDPSEL